MNASRRRLSNTASGFSLKVGRVAQCRSTFLKMSSMWLKNDKQALILVATRQFTLGKSMCVLLRMYSGRDFLSL